MATSVQPEDYEQGLTFVEQSHYFSFSVFLTGKNTLSIGGKREADDG